LSQSASFVRHIIEVELRTYVPCVCDKLFDADYSRRDFNRWAGRVCREEIFFKTRPKSSKKRNWRKAK
jgi:hypothetical protein